MEWAICQEEIKDIPPTIPKEGQQIGFCVSETQVLLSPS